MTQNLVLERWLHLLTHNCLSDGQTSVLLDLTVIHHLHVLHGQCNRRLSQLMQHLYVLWTDPPLRKFLFDDLTPFELRVKRPAALLIFVEPGPLPERPLSVCLRNLFGLDPEYGPFRCLFLSTGRDPLRAPVYRID